MITVAHCLPNLPPACTFGSESELTYQPLALLRGPAPTAQLLPYREEDRLIERSRPVPTENDGSDVRRVLARCCFVNPVSDIAVLERPDDQDLPDESDIFDALVGSVPAFRVSVPQDGTNLVRISRRRAGILHYQARRYMDLDPGRSHRGRHVRESDHLPDAKQSGSSFAAARVSSTPSATDHTLASSISCQADFCGN